MPTRTAITARNVYVDGLMHRADGGCVRVYTGEQPATPETPATGQLLVTGVFRSPAFPPAVDGIASATQPIDGTIEADGMPGWFRVVEADGVTPVWDGTCGTANADLLFDLVPLVAGEPFVFTALTYSMAMEEA